MQLNVLYRKTEETEKYTIKLEEKLKECIDKCKVTKIEINSGIINLDTTLHLIIYALDTIPNYLCCENLKTVCYIHCSNESICKMAKTIGNKKMHIIIPLNNKPLKMLKEKYDVFYKENYILQLESKRNDISVYDLYRDAILDNYNKNVSNIFFIKTEGMNYSYKKYDNILSKEENQKADKMYRNPRHQLEHICSKLIQRYVCIKHTSLNNSELVFSREDKYGKPFCKNKEATDLYYNVSHCNDYVVLVTSKDPVGVDIEKERKTIPDIVHKQFNNQVSFNNIHEYVYFWTKVESYLKLIGIGISGLNDLKINSNDLVHNMLNIDISKYLNFGMSGNVCVKKDNDMCVNYIDEEKIMKILDKKQLID